MLPTSEPQTLAPQMDPRKMAELLRLKVAGDPFPFSFIHEADPYSAAPEDLVHGREHAPGTDPGKGVAWYFCWSAECHGSAGGGSSSKRKRKVAAAGETYWHPETGKQAIIGTDGESMGAYKRTLSYVHKIRNSPAIATATPFTRKRLGWCMVEIGLDGPDQQLQVVLCKLYRPHPRPPTPAPAPLVPVPETPSRVAIVKNGSAAAALTVVIDLCGSSMPLVQRLKDMAKLVRRVESPEIVLSVMGNTTTATILLAAWKALRCRAEKVGGIHELLFIKELHLRMCDELGLERSIASGSLDELEHQLQHVAMTKELTPWTRDYLVSFCESMSTKIFYKYLNKHEATLQVWKLRAIATSGRGSSDLTGTTIDSTLESREIQDRPLVAFSKADGALVWKDVDGIFSCDPKVCTDATLVPHLTFDEAAELSDFTEQSMKQAMEYGISVRVRNPSKPQAPGTVITKTRDMSKSTLTSIVLKSNITMLDIKSKRMQGQSDFVITAFSKFQHFEYLGISVHCVRASGGEMSFILVPSELLSQELLIKLELDNVVEELQKIAEVHRLEDRSVISLIGNAHRSSSILEKALNVLRSINADVNKLSHESSKVMKAFLIVEKSREKDCLEALHSAFFVKNREPPAPPCGGVTYSSILESLEEALLSDDYLKPVADDDIEDQNDLPTVVELGGDEQVPWPPLCMVTSSTVGRG